MESVHIHTRIQSLLEELPHGVCAHTYQNTVIIRGATTWSLCTYIPEVDNVFIMDCMPTPV